MSYIQPNSRIEFFDDIGISQDYNDTLYFPSVSAKDAYFSNIDRLAHVDRCYYARENRGFVRVELPMFTMIHAQYMRFKNTSYENKWWYAFVDDVIYVNDNTTEVQFTLDPMMTWMGEFHLSKCYIERQHSVTDEVGDNIIPEPINIGTYVTSDVRRSGLFTNWVYMVFYSPNIIASAITEADVNDQLGIYSGMSVIVFPDDGTADTKLNVYRFVEVFFGAVQLVAYVPDAFVPRLAGVPGYSGTDRQENHVTIAYSIPRSSVYDNIDGYTPKNKKLYTSPYNVLAVHNTEGEENIYNYEFFANNQTSTIDFQLAASVNIKTEIRMAPYSYKGQDVNDEESLTMKDFPYATWTSDAFMAYMAQTLSNSPVRLLASGTNSKANGSSNSFDSHEFDRTFITEKDVTRKKTGLELEDVATHASRIGGSSLTVSQSIEVGAHIGKALISPAEVKCGSTADVSVLINRKDFWFLRKTINAQSARVIDDYFTMFGYAQKKVDVPNMDARPYWTYVKTIQCKINSRCPASDADFIEKCFNRGIRFWKDHRDIGNYSLNNEPRVGS